jgi:squalene-associated FAD-dependent desaturase
MIDERGHRSELRLPPLPAPFDLLAGIMSWDALSLADRWSILRMGKAIRGAEPVDPSESVRQWLERHDQSPRLCRLFWEPLALAALNQSIDVAAAAMFVAVTSRMFGGGPDAALVLVPAAPLDDLYTRPAAAFLERRGSTVSPRAKARIVIEDDRVVGVRVGEVTTAAERVICAVPWFALGDVFAPLPPQLRQTIARASAMGSAPIVTVNLWLDGFAMQDAMTGLPGRTFQWVFDRGRFVGHEQTHLSLISSGADAICGLPNDDLIKRASIELRDAVPETRRVALRHASVIRERQATFSLRSGEPPRPATTTAVRGLFLAGDWIDTGLPATIESAVLAGHRAAAAVMQHLG